MATLGLQPCGRSTQPVDLQKQSLEKQLAQAHRDNAILNHKMVLKDVLSDVKLSPGLTRAEKNERIEQALAIIAEAKKVYSLPIRTLAGRWG
jgi:hypothetical protein